MSKSNVRHAMPHFTDDSSAGASEQVSPEEKVKVKVSILCDQNINCQNIPEFLSQGKPWTNEFIKFNIKVTIIFHSKITLNLKKGSNSRVY